MSRLRSPLRLITMVTPHSVNIDGETIRASRLVLRPWTLDDAPAALTVFGDEAVTRWLSPAMAHVASAEEMAAVIASWLDSPPPAPAGRWAVTAASDGRVLGGVTVRPLPPERSDLEIGWQLDPAAWGQGYAAEAGHAVAHHAFEAGVEELFAVVRPRNTRGARTAMSIGMEWVGETEKYYDLRLQVYRLRKGELDVPRLPGRTQAGRP
jgi:RimJ/RimL family protein N-acetyltransferase